MSSPHTVTGVPAGRPAHAARPGVPPKKAGAILAGIVAAGAALWFAGHTLLTTGSPATTAPVSASLITVTPSTARP